MYKKRISGPIIDRIDLHIDLPPVKIEKLVGESKSESSKTVQKRVQKARDLQTKRYKKTKPASPSRSGIVCNSDLSAKDVKERVPLSKECQNLLQQAASTMHLSARTYYRIIKVARTIGDLEGEKEVAVHHIAEALQYRPKDDGIS